MFHLNQAMVMADEVAPLESKLRQAVKSGSLPGLLGLELIEAGAKAGVLSKEEAKRMRVYDKKIMNIIHVDEFAFDAFSRSTSTKTTKKRKKKAASKPAAAEVID